MKYSVVDTGDIFRLFRDVLKIDSRLAGSIISEIKKWLKNNGPEWTVNRLKDLKTQYLQLYAGNSTFRIETLSLRKDGVPRGPFRGLWTLGNSQRTVDKVLSTLMVYSGIRIIGKPSQRQLTKFYNAVERPKPRGELPCFNIGKEIAWLYRDAWYRVHGDPIESWVQNSSKACLAYNPEKGLVKVPETTRTVADHLGFAAIALKPIYQESFWACRQLMLSCQTKAFSGAVGLMRKAENLSAPGVFDKFKTLTSNFTEPLVGYIGFIQERGCKLRAVANPHRAIQCGLSRLANWLKLVAETSLPYDCTFDQDRGVRWAQRKLSRGVKLHAFDLSNASDTIPLEDQIAFLRLVGPPHEREPLDKDFQEFEDSLELFEYVSKGLWFDTNHPNKVLKWSKGQGLGIVCSFGAFSQLHGARLLTLSRNLGLEDAFVVLGDDVIVQDELAEAYETFVKEVWGCEISPSKTITSAILSEFASKVITKNKLLKSFKFPNTDKRLFNYARPLELLVKYGPRALKLVPSNLRAEVQVLSGLPKPKGLGWKWPASQIVGVDSREVEEFLGTEYRPRLPNIVQVKRISRVQQWPTQVRQDLLNKARIRVPMKERVVSYTVHTKSHIEKEQDLRVALHDPYSDSMDPLTLGDHVAMSHSIYQEGTFGRSLREKIAYSNSQVSLENIQFQILHANEARHEPSQHLDSMHEALDQMIADLPRTERVSEFEIQNGNQIKPTAQSRKGLRLWASATWAGVIGFLSSKIGWRVIFNRSNKRRPRNR